MAHPPRSNPPLRSSSGPPSPCITPSTETFMLTVSFMVMVPFSLASLSSGPTGRRYRSHRSCHDLVRQAHAGSSPEQGRTSAMSYSATDTEGMASPYSKPGPLLRAVSRASCDSHRSKLLMRVGSTESVVIARSRRPGASRARVTRSRMTATASSRSSGSTPVCPAMTSMRKSLPSSRREVGEEDHSGFEPLHVLEPHPDGSPVAEHVDVPLAPHQRVQVHLVLVDQTPLGEGVRELAAPVHEQVSVDVVLQLRDRFLEVPREQGRVPLKISGQGVGDNVLRQRVDHVRPLARLARPVSRKTLVGLAAQHQPAGSRLTLERVVGVVSVRLHPLADRVYHAVDGGLRGRDQLSHLDAPFIGLPRR